MDKILDGQFLRVEKALSTLITSIATYNPSPQLATDLVTADEELSKGLQQLSIHQANHQRILSLRATSQTLDDQIRETLTLLADTRAELIATPATVFPKNTNPVSYSELLSYARRISKFTKPPTTHAIESDGGEDGIGNARAASVKIDVQEETPDIKSNGSTTPVIANGISGSSNGGTGAVTPVEHSTALPAQVSQWLNPLNDGPAFVPWPTEETIRRGALASIQVLLDQGTDPATFDPEKSAELEAERKRLEEEVESRRVEREELARTERDQRAREEVQRRQSVGTSLGTVRREEKKPAQFQLMDLDEDDD